MKHLPDNQCRRCGQIHEDVWQYVDPDGRWAVTMVACECGHRWTTIHTSPANLSYVRRWIARDCEPADGPAAVATGLPWHRYRMEGVCPSLFSEAS